MGVHLSNHQNLFYRYIRAITTDTTTTTTITTTTTTTTTTTLNYYYNYFYNHGQVHHRFFYGLIFNTGKTRQKGLIL